MSAWIEIAGIIRYRDRAEPYEEQSLYERYREALGHTATHTNCTPDHYLDDLKRCTAPRGSEGSLEWDMYEDEFLKHCPRYIVRVWGSLRDWVELGPDPNQPERDPFDVVEEWFRRCVEHEDFIVDQAMLHVTTRDKHCVLVLIEDTVRIVTSF